ncbi:MAG: hypothetical protein ABIK43_07220 [candidate division WOR-3 bacterium]
MRHLSLLALFLASCHLPCCRTKPPVESSSVPESVQIEGRTLRLSVELWRDFQPISPPGGQPMMGIVRIVADDNLPLPADLHIEHIRLTLDKEQWTPTLSNQQEPLQLHLTNGPKWEPGRTAAAVVRLRRGEKSWLLRASGILIRRTD